MKILVVGSGGREHALIWKLNQSPKVTKIYCAPGNAGISELAECVPLSNSDIHGLLHFADKKRIDLTIVNPIGPLLAGIVDIFQEQGLAILGATQKAAEIESSKIYAKFILDTYHVPTAKYKTFESIKKAKLYLGKAQYPLIIKTNALTNGFSSTVCLTQPEAFAAVDNIMVKRIYGDFGKQVIIEEFLIGEEISISIFTDGIHFIPLVPVRVYKAIFDENKGSMTDGMGAQAPARAVNDKMLNTIFYKVIAPVIRGMALEGKPLRGVFNIRLILTYDGPKVIGFNCRFVDPETEAILPLLQTDILEILISCSKNELKTESVETTGKFSTCVIMASGGYPGNYQIGRKISGIDPKFNDELFIFHCGTKLDEGNYITNGGRVLAVTALADDVQNSTQNAYHTVGKIIFDGAYYRKDIGK